MMMTTSIQGITTPLQAAARSASAATIFYMVIDQPKPKEGGLRSPDVTASEDIVLENVNFAYPSRPEVKILNMLSLRFPVGKMTAIVGPSGSGKSTIVQLLERWYEMDGDILTNPMVLWLRNGSVTCGGTHLKDMEVKWWRSQIGIVQQEPFLFNDTIFRNVEYGLVGTEWENASSAEKSRRVKEACQEAFADEFITRLPEVRLTYPYDPS
jgi:ATP-binding cassette, subfamily B (MDR/TAP), member 1